MGPLVKVYGHVDGTMRSEQRSPTFGAVCTSLLYHRMRQQNSSNRSSTVDTKACRKLHVNHFAAQEALTDDELFNPEVGFASTRAWDSEYDALCTSDTVVELSKDRALREMELTCVESEAAPPRVRTPHVTRSAHWPCGSSCCPTRAMARSLADAG